MRIIYSFNKKGFEAKYWSREIAAASTNGIEYVPFNHGDYLDPYAYIRAQLLDNLYYESHPGLMRLYADFENMIREHGASAVIVDNCPPYHPDYLHRLQIYKVLRTTDGPLSAYDRDFAYLHAYDHVLYHSPAYSADFDMEEKLHYCGAKIADYWPLALFDAQHDATRSEAELMRQTRDIPVIFIGALHLGKMPLLARVKKAFGKNCLMRGLTTFKRNVYFNAKFRFPGWIRPVAFEDYVPLYQRAKIGFNVHNRGKFTVGSYRMFELPGNGVMQISDGGEYLERFFRPGEEIASYEEADELIDRIRYYLANDSERERIAMNGYRRVMREHRFRDRMHQAGDLIQIGMQRTGWN